MAVAFTNVQELWLSCARLTYKYPATDEEGLHRSQPFPGELLTEVFLRRKLLPVVYSQESTLPGSCLNPVGHKTETEQKDTKVRCEFGKGNEWEPKVCQRRTRATGM